MQVSEAGMESDSELGSDGVPSPTLIGLAAPGRVSPERHPSKGEIEVRKSGITPGPDW